MNGAAERYLKNQLPLKDYWTKSIINDAILSLDIKGSVGKNFFRGINK